jgi:5'-3' exonuclease
MTSLTPEEINWNLLHISILRDYIDLEFCSLKVRLKDRIEDDAVDFL